MKKVWISLRVIEGEYETEMEAGGAYETGEMEDVYHPLCHRIIGFTEDQIEVLLQYLKIHDQQ